MKCLTWQAEEPQIVPKKPEVEEKIDWDSCSFLKNTPPSTPTHPKPLLAMQFPVMNHLDHGSRISERIHGLVPREELPRHEKAEWVEVEESTPYIQRVYCNGDSPQTRSNPDEELLFVRERVPTHVPTNTLLRTFSETKSRLFAVEKRLPVRECKSLEEIVGVGMLSEDDEWGSASSTTLEEFATPKLSTLLEQIVMEHLEETEEDGDSCGEEQINRGCRMIHRDHAQLQCHCPSAFRQKIINLTRRLDEDFSSKEQLHEEDEEDEEEWDTVFLSNETRPKSVNVHVIPEEWEYEDDDCLEGVESLSDIPDPFNSLHRQVLCMQVHNAVAAIEEDDGEESIPEEEQETLLRPCGIGSKFRSHFAREYGQMERMGEKLKELRKLQQMTERFSVVRPYLEEIEALDKVQHALPDLALDAEIASCCGWNVDLEFQKVTLTNYSNCQSPSRITCVVM
jgi:hypothetical protein